MKSKFPDATEHFLKEKKIKGKNFLATATVEQSSFRNIHIYQPSAEYYKISGHSKSLTEHSTEYRNIDAVSNPSCVSRSSKCLRGYLSSSFSSFSSSFSSPFLSAGASSFSRLSSIASSAGSGESGFSFSIFSGPKTK